MKKTNLSILIPVYNEEEILEKNVMKLVKFLDENFSNYEVIICSNGSNDKTNEIGRDLSHIYQGKVKFLSIDRRGVGLAFKEMVSNAKNEKLISLDMDLSIDMSFILECEKLLDSYDIVIGSKQLGKQNRRFYRKFISDCFITMVNSLLDLEFGDYSIAAKGYRKSKILKYLNRVDHGSFYVIDIIFHGKKDNLKLVEVPVLCEDKRKSKFNLYEEILYRFKNLLKLWISEILIPRIKAI